jgi:hypothetical protein
MTGHCYICKHPSWRTAKINLDYYNIELLNELLDDAQGFPDLNSIIKVSDAYRKYSLNLIENLKQYHVNNCYRCTSCKQHVPEHLRKTTPTVPSGVDYGVAMCYFSGLNGVQYKVLEKLKACIPEIRAIDHMIGMDNIKKEFARVIKYLATYDPVASSKEPLMHMGIYGPPGHGKTQIARLIGKAFAKSGLLTKPDVFVVATRADLIGAYCGHTAKNTTKQFDDARGGVIFIDEIYSLGNPEKKDAFTKECIDTINQLLSERTDTLCIIAGYEEDAEQSFFAYNKGLARRFPFNFVIKPYTEEDLTRIFCKLAGDDGWEVMPGAILTSDLKDRKLFDNAGGDMENLLVKSVMAHYENSFLSMNDHKKLLTRKDVEMGLAAYKLNKKVKKDPHSDPPPPGMYS